MSIRGHEITELVNQAQKADIETVLQNDKLDLYQFKVCCDISLAYTAKFLEEHPEVISRVKKLFENNDTYYLQRDLRAQFNEELDEVSIKEKYSKLMQEIANNQGTWREPGPNGYRAAGFDPYMPDNSHYIAMLAKLTPYDILLQIQEQGKEEALNQKAKELGIDKIELSSEWRNFSRHELVTVFTYNKNEEVRRAAIRELHSKDFINSHQDFCCELLYPEGKSKATLLQERHKAAEKLNGWFNFEESFQKTEQRVKQSSGEDCFRVCMTPMSEYDEYKAAQTLKMVFEAYYDQTSFLSERGTNTDLYYTDMKNSSAFKYARYALLDIGRYHDQPALEQHFESRIGDLLLMKTIDGVVPHYNNGEKCEFSHYSGFGAAIFKKRMIETVLKDPTSEESQFYFKYEDVLDRHVTVYDYRGSKGSTYRTIIEGLIVSHPDSALKLLNEVKDSCNATYLGKLYDISQNKALLPMIASRLKEEQQENGTYTLYDKLLACKYSQYSDNPELKEIVKASLSKDIQIDDKVVSLLKEDVDYKPVLENAKNKSARNMVVELMEPQPEDMSILQQIMPKFSNLERIEFKMKSYDSHYPEMEASAFLSNPKLKVLDLKKCVINHAEKLLELPLLKDIEKQQGTFKNPRGFWSSLEENRPEHLERIGFSGDNEVKEEKAEALMEKYPDLVIDWNCSSLYHLKERNEAIIAAKKSKALTDIAEVIHREGLAEYLKIIDPKDRITFEDLSKKVASERSSAQSLLKHIRDSYGEPCYTSSGTEYRTPERYTEVLAQVADLCDIKELKKEIALIKAVQEKCVVEHLKSLKPEERPTLLSLFKDKTIGTVDGETIVENIKKTYQDDYAGTMSEILMLFGATKEDLALLKEDKDLDSVVKQYAERQQYDKTAAFSKSAFEKWKQQNGQENG